ncbi:MAG: hypothetical protein ABEJ80_05980 [Halarchaeum sp.]
MKGIAISLYDKFDDLAILVDIVRNNWEDDYFISVCSNHPDAESRLDELDVDHAERGAQIRYDGTSASPHHGHNLHYRIHDSIRRACRTAIDEPDVEHVMHLHADAWVLSEDGYDDVVTKMENAEAAVAFPADSDTFMETYPPGYFNDQFIIFDATAAREAELFQHSAVQFPPISIHQLLPLICIASFGWGGIHQYSASETRQHWDGRPRTEYLNHARPMFYDPTYGQLHLATEDFGGRLGRELQAYYLRKYGLTDGKHVGDLLDDHTRSEDALFADLEAYFDSFDDQLRWYGLSVDDFGRDVRSICEFLNEDSVVEKLRQVVIWKYHDAAFYPLLKGIEESIGRLRGKSTSEWGTDEEYVGKTVDAIYAGELNPDDFPPELREDLRDAFDSRP